MKKKVLIDSSSNLPYASFYLQGIFNIYGRNNVYFVSEPFKDLDPLEKNLRFIIKNNNIETKVFINTNDSYKINIKDYDWCDVYGNVNANYKYFPKESYPKQISLVPSFAVRNFNILDTIYFSVTNFLKSYTIIINRTVWNKFAKNEEKNTLKNIKRHFLDYFKNYLYRMPLVMYKNKYDVIDLYVFFLSTLWYSNEYNQNDEGVNRRRANFVEVCKSVERLRFEGGLVGDNSSSNNLFIDSITDLRLPLNMWIKKTKKSLLVFNTPAFWDCHGWKLGEYLALGKAIISTPLSNDLPAPLVHGVHIHIIPDASKDSIKDAISYIIQHPEYRKTLEKNARLYWEKYGTPEKSLFLLGLHNDIQ